MTVVIIDYGSGNLRSAAKAFERVANDSAAIQITRSPEVVQQASHIVLPGVGAFADCMNGLKALPGMLAALRQQVLERGTPFLGICVGMQMLFTRGHEHGVHEGLGWLKGEVIGIKDSGFRIQDSGSEVSSPNPESRILAPLKIPHMGWNDLTVHRTHPLMRNIQTGNHVYFVHSYHAACADASDVLATTEYGQNIAAVVGRGNIMGTQFHPEKSQETGLQLIKNFLSLA